MCRKRSLQGSEQKERKRLAPEQKKGVKRSIPPSISSRTYKFKRPNTSSQGVESIAGPSRLPDCRLNKSTTVESGRKVVGVITRPARPEQQRKDATNTSGETSPVESSHYKESLPILSTQPSEGKRRNSRGAEEHRNQRHPSQQNKEKKPQYGSVG
ncbi:hypothetical protein TNCV_3840951 [Trichonephila clavipes]|nr:hypothetical protein TNCV_3840951 [Trichonephila clavipes]